MSGAHSVWYVSGVCYIWCLHLCVVCIAQWGLFCVLAGVWCVCVNARCEACGLMCVVCVAVVVV